MKERGGERGETQTQTQADSERDRSRARESESESESILSLLSPMLGGFVVKRDVEKVEINALVFGRRGGEGERERCYTCFPTGRRLQYTLY